MRSKNESSRQELIEALGGFFLAIRDGESIPSIRELSGRFKTSTGTISNVIHDLEELDAVKILRRGKLGSFLEHKSEAKLWRTISDGPLVISLTMPTFPKCEGLATAIYCLLNDAGIETYLIFIRGSYNRIKALRDRRCHATVMSTLAAKELAGSREEIILTLPAKLFVSDHRIFFRNAIDLGDANIRVAMDKDSYDLKYLTEIEFPRNQEEYFQITLMQIGNYLVDGDVDAAIWNSDHMEPLITDDISSRPLSPKTKTLIGDDDSSAALVTRSSDIATKMILRKFLKEQSILEVQNMVITGEIVARY